MKKRVWIVISLILAVVPLLIPLEGGHRLAPLRKWVARYNGPANGDDVVNAIAVDGSGNIYVTGRSWGSGTDYDYATIKYNTSGKQLWAKRYNGPVNDEDFAAAITVDGSGNVYVTGRSLVSGSGPEDVPIYDYATIKYSPNGIQLWVNRYDGPGNGDDQATSVAVDGTGNVYITGSSGSDYATIKYNPNGKQLWVKRYNGPGNQGDGATAMAVDRSGNVYVTGSSAGLGTSYDYATIKYDTNGQQLWVRRYNGPDNNGDAASAIAVDGAGNAFVTGHSLGLETYQDYVTIKYSPSGKQLWTRRYNGPANGSDYANAIAVDGSGNVYVTGSSGGSVPHNYYDYATIKYSANGQQLWENRYNGPANSWDEARAIAVDPSGNVFVTGGSAALGTWHWDDYTTIKYNASGQQLWIDRFDGPGNDAYDEDTATAIAVDRSGNVYVTGWSMGSGTGFDYATIKY